MFLADSCLTRWAAINPKPAVMTGGFGIESVM